MLRKPRTAWAAVMPATCQMAFTTFVKLVFCNTASASLETSEALTTKRNISSTDRPLPLAKVNARVTASARVKVLAIVPPFFKSL